SSTLSTTSPDATVTSLSGNGSGSTAATGPSSALSSLAVGGIASAAAVVVLALIVAAIINGQRRRRVGQRPARGKALLNARDLSKGGSGAAGTRTAGGRSRGAPPTALTMPSRPADLVLRDGAGSRSAGPLLSAASGWSALAFRPIGDRARFRIDSRVEVGSLFSTYLTDTFWAARLSTGDDDGYSDDDAGDGGGGGGVYGAAAAQWRREADEESGMTGSDGRTVGRDGGPIVDLKGRGFEATLELQAARRASLGSIASLDPGHWGAPAPVAVALPGALRSAVESGTVSPSPSARSARSAMSSSIMSMLNSDDGAPDVPPLPPLLQLQKLQQQQQQQQSQPQRVSLLSTLDVDDDGEDVS
ncbi:hypothetical protein HK405_001153, partial [Cladochytrium tenue]